MGDDFELDWSNPEIITVTPEEYERVLSILLNPGPPTPAAQRGAEMLRKLAKSKSPWEE